MESELLERIERWAKETPHKSMLTFVDDKGNVTMALTCNELYRKMQNLAALLVATPSQHPKGFGLKAGDRVVLVYPPGLEFIIAFLACLRAGIVAVPVYPPDPRKVKKEIHMFVAVLKNCNASIALTTSTYAYVKKIAGIKQKITFSEQFPWPDHLQWVVTDELIDIKSPWLDAKHTPQTSDVAFLQYTSGSTSTPKGVMLTHGNLNHNLRTITSALQAGRDTIVVSWLPQYHDMGLIGAYLGTIFNGGNSVYMSPFSFIKDPMLWIRLISMHRATHLQAPNFAYALCARKVDGLKTSDNIDLSCIKHMINGAEPIQGEVMEAFYHAFQPYGLVPGVIKPTYGLAEHTVYVCGSGQQRVWVNKVALEQNNEFIVVAPQEASQSHGVAKEMIGCGIPSRRDHGIDVRVVDQETEMEQPEGHVGEIWITSPSKALGYYGTEMQSVSKEVFYAKIKSSTVKEEEYLRTGDMGVVYNQELFICGRMKDLVIIRGRNHYPQDLEATAESYTELRPGCSAAFSFSDGSSDGDVEKLALVAELRDAEIKNKASLSSNIRRAIAQEHGVKVTLIILIPPRTIPKTTSGKISRNRVKKAMEDKQLTVLYRNEDMIGDVDEELNAVENETMDRRTEQGQAIPVSNTTTAPPEQVYEFLVTELAKLLDVDKRSLHGNTLLQDVGMDSMALTQLQGIITQKYQVHVAEDVLYNETTTIGSLHAALCGLSNNLIQDPHSNLMPGQQQRKKEPKLCCGCIAC